MEETPTETTLEVEVFPCLLEDPSLALEVELAVAFTITEVNREKGKGMLRKKPKESITLFSKILWPYWFMKTKGGALIADGQGLPELNLTFSQVPKPEEIENILSSSDLTADYINSLKRTTELLTNLPIQKVPLTALVEPELSQQLANHKKNIIKINPMEIRSTTLEPNITEADARTIASNFDKLVEDRNSEIEKFEIIKKTIETHTGAHFKKLDDQTRETLKTYSDKLDQLKKEVEQEIVRLKMKQSEDIKKTDELKLSEGKLIVNNLRTTFDPVKSSFSNAQNAVEDHVESKIPPGKEPELAFDLAYGAVNYIKSQIDLIRESLKATEKDIDNLKNDWKNKEADVEAKKKEIISKTEEAITNQNKRITDTEEERDKKIDDLKNSQKIIENLTKELFTKIEEQKNRLLDENATMKEFLISEAVMPLYTDESITYLPLYFAKYINEKNEGRFIIIPPIATMMEKKDVGIDIGDKKLHSMIYTPFNEYIKIRIEEALTKDKSLREAVERIMNENNFMMDKTIESTIYDGLKALAANKTIKEKDVEEFSLACMEAFRTA